MPCFVSGLFFFGKVVLPLGWFSDADDPDFIVRDLSVAGFSAFLWHIGTQQLTFSFQLFCRLCITCSLLVFPTVLPNTRWDTVGERACECCLLLVLCACGVCMVVARKQFAVVVAVPVVRCGCGCGCVCQCVCVCVCV